MTQIYFLETDTTIPWEALQPLLPLISESRQQRIAHIPSLINKKLCLYAELLLRRAACEQLAIRNDALHFTWSEQGKPCLEDVSDFHFNWSHSKQALALALSTQPVGIDIELLRPANFKLAQRFFTPAEVAFVSENNQHFFHVWTRKEAYTKYTGSGLTIPLDSFDVVADSQISSHLNTFLHRGYMITLCGENPSYEFVELKEPEVLSRFHDYSTPGE